MLRVGCIVLSIWAGLNLLPSVFILVSTGLLDRDAPAVAQILDAEEIEALSEHERVSINSVAVYANGLNAAFCATALWVIWCGLNQRVLWAFWCLVTGFVLAFGAGTLADAVVGMQHPQINLVSAVILFCGCGLSAVDLFWLGRRSVPAV